MWRCSAGTTAGGLQVSPAREVLHVRSSPRRYDHCPAVAALPDLKAWLHKGLALRGWQAADLARRARLSEGLISMLLSGERKGSRVSTQVSLAQAFGLEHRAFVEAVIASEHPPPADPARSMSAKAVRDAVRDDPNLTPAQRKALIGVYESYVRGGRGG